LTASHSSARSSTQFTHTVTSQGAFLSRLTLDIQGIWGEPKQEPNIDHRIQVQEIRSPRPPWPELIINLHDQTTPQHD